MAKRIRRRIGRRHRTRDNRLPLLTLAGIAANQRDNIAYAMSGGTDPMTYLDNLLWSTCAYQYKSGTWAGPMKMIENLSPIIVGAIGSKVMTRIGANRTMKKIPFVGRYIKL